MLMHAMCLCVFPGDDEGRDVPDGASPPTEISEARRHGRGHTDEAQPPRPVESAVQGVADLRETQSSCSDLNRRQVFDTNLCQKK